MYNRNDQVKEDEMDRAHSTNGKEEESIMLVRKPEGRRPLERKRHRWIDIIKFLEYCSAP
jgi:hypothetical protein